MTIRRWGDRSRSSVTGENVGGGADHDSLERDASATIGHTKKKEGLTWLYSPWPRGIRRSTNDPPIQWYVR